jgi:small subunit ribosomal protein S6
LSGHAVRTLEPRGGSNLRRYETIFITYADLPDEEITALIERYGAIVKAKDGVLIKTEKWGKRKLAYEIKKQSRGNYVLFDFAGSSAIVTELERNLRIGDKILKYMTVKTQETVNLQEIEQEMAASAAAGKPEEPAPAPAEQEKPAMPEAPQTAPEEVAVAQESDASLPADTSKEEKE